MSWPVRIGVGVVVLAALAAGQAIDSTLPIDHVDERPFVHAAGIGDRVHLAYADVAVNAVRTARAVDNGQASIGTPGRWLVVDLTVVAWGRPLAKPGISLEDGNGRRFGIDPRTGYSWVSAPTGVPWQVRIPFEVPEDALRGATLVLSRTAGDHRRDDVARIDLGIGTNDVARLWATQDTIEVPQAGMGAL